MTKTRKNKEINLVELVLFQKSFYRADDINKSPPVSLEPIGAPNLVSIGREETHKIENVKKLAREEYSRANAYCVNEEIGLAPSLWMYHPIQFYRITKK